MKKKRAPVRSALWLTLLALGASACASLRFDGAAAFRVECNVSDAALLIDDTFVGRSREWAVDGRFVKPGVHRIEIRHPDYYSHYAELNLKQGDAVLLKVALHRLLD